MNLVDTEAKPEAGHRLDVGVGREHPRAVRTHRGDGVGPRLIRCHVRAATERLEVVGNDGTTIRIIDYEQAVRNASCARDGCADQIFLTKSDVEHLRNGTSLSMNEAWRSAGAALGAKRGAHSSLRRFFLDGARKARTSHIT